MSLIYVSDITYYKHDARDFLLPHIILYIEYKLIIRYWKSCPVPAQLVNDIKIRFASFVLGKQIICTPCNSMLYMYGNLCIIVM